MEKISTRPLQIDKNKMQKTMEDVFSAMFRILSQLRIKKDFQDLPLKETPVKSLLEKLTPMVSVLEIQMINGPKRQIPLQISFSIPKGISLMGRKFVVGGHVRSIATRASKRRNPYEMEISFSLNVSQEEFLEKKNFLEIKKEIYSVLIHEMTHAEDWMKITEVDSEDPYSYYNDPSEIRAFLQQISDEIISHPLNSELSPKENFEKALSSSRTWLRVKPFQSTESKRITLKGAWVAYQDAIRSGILKYPFTLKKIMTANQLVSEIVQLRKQNLLEKDSLYYKWTSSENILKKHMRILAEKEMLADALYFGDYGVAYEASYNVREKIEKHFSKGE